MLRGAAAAANYLNEAFGGRSCRCPAAAPAPAAGDPPHIISSCSMHPGAQKVFDTKADERVGYVIAGETI